MVFFVFRVLPRRKVGLFGGGLIMFNGIKYRLVLLTVLYYNFKPLL